MSERETLTICTLNVLASCYANGSHTRAAKVPSDSNISAAHSSKLSYLSWDKRAQLLEERLAFLISEESVDILCLQEVDHYLDFYAPVLIEKLSMECVYAQRPKREDGLLIAWKREDFAIITKQVVDFNSIQGLPKDGEKDNIALVALLASRKDPQKKVLLANVHVHWNPMQRLLKVRFIFFLANFRILYVLRLWRGFW